MNREEIDKHITDAMDESNSRINALLERNASDKELEFELGIFEVLDKTRQKYKIPYTIQRIR